MAEFKRFSVPADAPILGIYVHYKKGDEYEVTGVSLDTDTRDSDAPVWRVEYTPLYPMPAAPRFNKELSKWLEMVEKDGGKIVRYRFVRPSSKK